MCRPDVSRKGISEYVEERGKQFFILATVECPKREAGIAPLVSYDGVMGTDVHCVKIRTSYISISPTNTALPTHFHTPHQRICIKYIQRSQRHRILLFINSTYDNRDPGRRHRERMLRHAYGSP